MCCQQEGGSDRHHRALAMDVGIPSFGLSTCQIGGYHGMIIRPLSRGKQRGQLIRMWDGSGAARRAGATLQSAARSLQASQSSSTALAPGSSGGAMRSMRATH